jgi:hypothetical protein
MAKDYVSACRNLLAIPKSNGKTNAARPRYVDFNGGNAPAPVALDEPLLTLFEASK